ncbi:MAG: pyridoxamine 5'-phosphate oxidase family protein [Candidatus Omnitrophica bacterium]|nr:pyridoxamine 5'-phosphate oxidase family protein [Candidatus Omnitrophota bacterium]
MIKLNNEVYDFFKNQTFVIVTTLDPDGSPHNSCKDIIRISRDGRIYLLDLYLKSTFNNLKNNPRMCIAQVNEESFTGYCLKGTGKSVKIKRLTPGIMRVWQRKITARITNRIISNLKKEKGQNVHPESLLPRPEYLIVMDVKEIIDLTPQHIKQKTIKT